MKISLLCIALLLLLGCSDASTPLSRTGSAEVEVDARGQTLSLACQACHSLQNGGPELVGPNLFGVFGRPAGKLASYGNYSQALSVAEFTWTPERLDAWLADPAGFLPGTTMAFTGYRAPEDRAALIDYLVGVTGDPQARQ